MNQEKTVNWKNMNWKQRVKFILGVLMGVSVKYYEETPDKKDSKNS